jgi:hypothetical protein
MDKLLCSGYVPHALAVYVELIGLDTDTGPTHGFGLRVFMGMGTGQHFTTHAISMYPTHKPSGFYRSSKVQLEVIWDLS